jgi:hypothetical protein
LHGRISEIRLGRANDVRIIISLDAFPPNRAASDELLLKNCKFFVALQFTNEVLTSVTFDFLTAGIDGRELIDPSIKLTNTTIAEVEQSLCKAPFNPSTSTSRRSTSRAIPVEQKLSTIGRSPPR